MEDNEYVDFETLKKSAKNLLNNLFVFLEQQTDITSGETGISGIVEQYEQDIISVKDSLKFLSQNVDDTRDNIVSCENSIIEIMHSISGERIKVECEMMKGLLHLEQKKMIELSNYISKAIDGVDNRINALAKLSALTDVMVKTLTENTHQLEDAAMKIYKSLD